MINKRFFGGPMTKKVTQITDEFTYWLGKRYGFNLNNEYKIDLIWIDKENNSCKIKITNLKTKEEPAILEVSCD